MHIALIGILVFEKYATFRMSACATELILRFAQA
jgi:hypothetical protein